jgi:uncharacterized membrane protein
MNRLQTHLRNKLLAGALAAGPVVILVWGVVWLETQTKPLTQPLGFHFPGMGILLALALIYLLGLLVTSLLGSIALALADKALTRIPGLNLLYRGWKDILVLPPSKAGMLHRVVLVRQPGETVAQLGFTSGEALPGDPATCCVFVPGVPNPLVGRLLFVDRGACVPIHLSTEEAFKFLLSSGNYVPDGMPGFGDKAP